MVLPTFGVDWRCCADKPLGHGYVSLQGVVGLSVRWAWLQLCDGVLLGGVRPEGARCAPMVFPFELHAKRRPGSLCCSPFSIS
jgi:hypothetical protein